MLKRFLISLTALSFLFATAALAQDAIFAGSEYGEEVVNPFADNEAPQPPYPSLEMEKPAVKEGSVEVEVVGRIQKTTIALGQTLVVSLSQEEPYEWSFSEDLKFLKLQNVQVVNGQTFLTFDTLNQGKERLYFDYLDKSDGSVKVLEARILDVEIEI